MRASTLIGTALSGEGIGDENGRKVPLGQKNPRKCKCFVKMCDCGVLEECRKKALEIVQGAQKKSGRKSPFQNAPEKKKIKDG